MAELVFLIVCVAGAFLLAMRRAPLWGWTLALAAALVVWQSGLLWGERWCSRTRFLRRNRLASRCRARPLVRTGDPAAPRSLRPCSRRSRAFCRKCRQPSRHALDAGTIGFDAELFSGHAGLGQAASGAADYPDDGRAGLYRRPDQRALPHGQRLDHSLQQQGGSRPRSGTSSSGTVSSACSSPRSMAVSASRRRRNR